MPILELGHHESGYDIENRKGWTRIAEIINGHEFNLLAKKTFSNSDLKNAQTHTFSHESNKLTYNLK